MMNDELKASCLSFIIHHSALITSLEGGIMKDILAKLVGKKVWEWEPEKKKK